LPLSWRDAKDAQTAEGAQASCLPDRWLPAGDTCRLEGGDTAGKMPALHRLVLEPLAVGRVHFLSPQKRQLK
jgi:hypothetical protein